MKASTWIARLREHSVAAGLVGASFVLVAGLVAIVILPKPQKFTLIVLPDTQHYSEYYTHFFEDQVRWIVDQVEVRNIVFVAHAGDIVEHYDSLREWEVADSALSELEDMVPFSVLPGNHDMSSDRDTSIYNRYFPPERFQGKSWYGGSYPLDSNDNSYQLFSAGGFDFPPIRFGQDKFLVLNLEFCPTLDVLEWAEEVLKLHGQRRAILVTHGYLNYEAERHAHEPSGGCSDESGNTDYIFEQLVYPYANVFLVLSGHGFQLEYGQGEARRMDLNAAGIPVHQLLANYQRRSKGGEGWLRIIDFNPEFGQVTVQTYSPSLGEYEQDEDSDFSFDYPAKPSR